MNKEKQDWDKHLVSKLGMSDVSDSTNFQKVFENLPIIMKYLQITSE